MKPSPDRGRLLDFTFPLVAIAAGRKINELLESEFGTLRIEDLPRRFFCVSADLTTAEEVVHDEGLLWPAIRASLSIPGVFPPVGVGGRLLVDGAVLNNLPVDVMRSRLPSGFVTAVDLFVPVENFTVPQFDPRASGWRLLKQRLLTGKSSSSALGLVDIMSRASSLSSMRSRQILIAQEAIDLHVHPTSPPWALSTFKRRPARLSKSDTAPPSTLSLFTKRAGENYLRVTKRIQM